MSHKDLGVCWYEGYVKVTYQVHFPFDFSKVEVPEGKYPFDVAKEAYLAKYGNLTLNDLVGAKLWDVELSEYFDITDAPKN